MKLLIIEDDRATADFITKGFEREGFTVCIAGDGLDGLFKARTEIPDVAIVDLMLPKLDGLHVIHEIRTAGLTFPIIILSAKDAVEDKVKGLEYGGDDYLAKPFSFTELVARVQALLRRAQHQSEPTLLKVEDLTLDRIARKVQRNGIRIELQPLEFSLLEYLMYNRGRVVSKTTIMEHVWKYDFDPNTNVVEARVCRLREKIDKAYERKLIRTIKGFGYVLE
ncbi:MAG: response regulator transcription factor [Kiritimatiellia bacterium]